MELSLKLNLLLLLTSTFPWCCLLCCKRSMVLTFKSVDKILTCYIQMKATEHFFLVIRANYVVQGGFNF